MNIMLTHMNVNYIDSIEITLIQWKIPLEQCKLQSCK